MLLITLRARKTDPIKAETIVKYLDSYISKAKIIKRKMVEEISYENPEVITRGGFGTFIQKTGVFKHQSENVNITLSLPDRFSPTNLEYDQAHRQCVNLFLEKSGILQSISSWTTAKESWAQSV